MAAEPLLFLTGHVATVFPPGLATEKIRHQEIILRVAARDQPAKGLVRIQFIEEHMSLLDGLRLGEYVAVGLPVHGVDYYRDGATKYLVVLTGQQLAITPELGQRKNFSGRHAAPHVAATAFSARPAPVPFPRSRAFGDEPPF